MAILDALNAAILRQKNLQMTSSTLKPMNDPYYPLKPTIHPRKKLIIGAYLATLLFTIFFFLIIEVLDRTLRYVFKAEQITGSRVLGVFTRPLNLRARRFNQTYTEMSARTLCNYAITYFKPNQNNIINLISNQSGEGKNYVMQQLAKQFTAQGMEVTQLSWHEEHQADAQSFIQVLDIEKLEGTTSSRQKLLDLLFQPMLERVSHDCKMQRRRGIFRQVKESRMDTLERIFKTEIQDLALRCCKIPERLPLRNA